eukprot:TRINITY_DN8719_c0_g2_i1.p1 TRINITY_DN8719_c0_g2~~TRINITY_DN8719_c0_g2_i1.p1  ORF type:complete len:3517 (+),score=722.39 TRINITY_DN8719_c0_g2_i1:99-10649(+)
MMNLFSFKKSPGKEKRKKSVANQEPPAEVVEEELDAEWMTTHEVGIKLQDAWVDIPGKTEHQVGAQVDMAVDAPVPVLDWAVDKESGPAFREQYIAALKDWKPKPDDCTLPICYLTHLCDALSSLVDALTRVDTSMPRGRAPHQYQAVVITLECLEIASRSPLNVRFMVDRGLLTDISKLIEAVVAGLWPLALPLACLRGSTVDSPDGSRLDDKMAQVMLRIGVLSQCMKLVHATVVTQHDVTNLKHPDSAPTTSLRKPMSKIESAEACLLGNPPLAKVLSWSIVMLVTHVVHAINGDECAGLFTALWQMLDTMKVVVRPVVTTKQGVNKERLNQLLESELIQALISSITWPVETSYKVSDTDQPVNEESMGCIYDSFEPAKYVLNQVSDVRRDSYSLLQRTALEIAVCLLDDHPESVRKLLPSGLIDACAETATWHVIHYDTKSSQEATVKKIESQGLLAQTYVMLPEIDNADEYVHIEVPSELSGVAPVSNPDYLLIDVLDRQPDQLQHVLELLKELSNTAYGVREYANEQLIRKIAAKERSLGLQGRRPSNLPDAGELLDGAERLELLSLEMFSGMFPPSTRPPARERPPSANLAIALRMQRNYFQLQLFSLSALIAFIIEYATSSKGHHDPMRSKIEHRGLEALNAQGIHRVLLESDMFYLSCFDFLSRTKTLREPLRPVWELPDGADSKTLRVLVRNLCKHIFHSLMSQKGKDIRPDLVALLEMMKKFRYSCEIVLDMGAVLLEVCRNQKELLDDSQTLGMLVDILGQAFHSQHEVVCSLKGNSFISHTPMPGMPAMLNMPSMNLGKPAMSARSPPSPSTPVFTSKVSNSSLNRRAKSFCNSPLQEKTPPFPSPMSTPPTGPLQVPDKRLLLAKRNKGNSPQFQRAMASSSSRNLSSSSPPMYMSSPPTPTLAMPIKTRAKAKTIVLMSPKSPALACGPSPFTDYRSMHSVLDVPPGVTEDDLPSYFAARNVILNIFDSLNTIPLVRNCMLLNGPSVHLTCLSERSLRLYGVKQLSHLLKTTGEGVSDGDKLGAILRPTVMELIKKLTNAPSGLILTILMLLQEVLNWLEKEEMEQLLDPNGKPNGAGLRRKVIQNLDENNYCKLVTVLTTPCSDGADPYQLGVAVLDTVACLLKGNPKAKALFEQEVGWMTLGDAILECMDHNPSQSMFDQLLNVLVDGEESVTIENEGLLPVILHWCTLDIFCTNTTLILDLTKKLKTILSFSTHNLERASRVGILEILVDMLVRWEDREIRAQLIECYHRVGKHCITVKQLKPLFTALRDQQGRERMLLLPWVIRILRNLAQTTQAQSDRDRRKSSVDEGIMTGGSGSTGENSKNASSAPTKAPPAFFDFSGVHSGLKLPDLSSYPSSNGYSISMWIRIESQRPPCLAGLSDLESYKPHLYSFQTEDGSDLLAFFEMDRLCFTVQHHGENPSTAVIDTVAFMPKRWYHLYVSHSCGKRIISRAEVKVYVDGVEKWRGPLKYPRNNVLYTSCIGTNMKGYRQETLLNNFYGQVCCVYFIDGAVSSAVVGAIHGLGPAYQSNFAPADRDKIVSTLGLADTAKALFNEFHSSKIYMLYNPLASQGGMLVNVAGLNQMDEIGEKTDLSEKQQDLVLAAVLPGTQLCLTQALRQVLGSMGGLMVLFPLVALLGEHRSALIPDEPVQQTAQLSTSIVPFLVSNLLSLFHDLFKTHPLFICEIRDNKLYHVLNMLLKPIAPFLDKSNIERINLMIYKVWNEETWKEGVQYLLLDLSIWVQTPATIQQDLFITVYSKLAKAASMQAGSAGKWFVSMRPFGLILDQLTWFLYYNEPPTPVDSKDLKDKDMRERMHGKRGLTDRAQIRAVRKEALESAFLLLCECSSDDVAALCANFMNPLNDHHQLEDLVEFLVDLLERKRDTLIEPLFKYKGLDILLHLMTMGSSALRQGCVSCLGVMVQHSKKVSEYLCCSKPYGLATVAENLGNYSFDIQTYKVLRDAMLFTVHKPQKGLRTAAEQQCKPLSSERGKDAIELPAAIVTIMKLAIGASMEIKEMVAQDVDTLIGPENCRILCDMAWPLLAADLLASLPYDDPELTDRVEATKATLLKVTSEVLFDAMMQASGWKMLDGFINAIYEKDKLCTYKVLEGVFTQICDLYLDATAKGKVTQPSERDKERVPSIVNSVYFAIFIEDLLCFHPTISSCLKTMRFGLGAQPVQGLKTEENDMEWVEVTEDGDKAESSLSSTTGSPVTVGKIVKTESLESLSAIQRKGYHEAAELQADQKTTAWSGWHLALKCLSLLFTLGLYKTHEFTKEVDTVFTYASAQQSVSRTTTFLTRPGGLTRLCTRFIRLCLAYQPVTPGNALPTPPSRKDLLLLLSFVKSIIALDKMSDRDRERFEELLTSDGRTRLAQESRSRTLTLLNSVACHVTKLRQRNRTSEIANDSASQLECLNCIKFIFAERQKLLDNELVEGSPRQRKSLEWVLWIRTNKHSEEDLAKFDDLVLQKGWQSLHMIMLPVSDTLCQEVGDLWMDIAQRRRKTASQEQRELFKQNEETKRHVLRTGSKPPMAPKCEYTATYKDLQRTSEKYWKQLLSTVTNDRGTWALQPKTRFVRRSVQEVGGVNCRIRPKLVHDPKLTDHANITTQKDINQVHDMTDKAVKINHHEVGSGNEDDDAAETCEEDDKDIPPPPSKSGWKFNCEVIWLMQGWSGSFQIIPEQAIRCLWVLIDEANTSIVQAMNPASEHLVEKPKDDKFLIDTLKNMVMRRYRMQMTAIEFYFVDGSSLLLNFEKKEDVHQIFKVILHKINPKAKNLRTTEIPKSPVSSFKKSRLTEKWVKREISNFEYLMGLNHYASRTVNDLTQYPVMPWILCDYHSKEINLENEAIYRDLSQPLGCLGGDARKSTERTQETITKYDSLESIGMTPFHFGSHYSNSGFTLFYLLRLEPYTTAGIILQGAKFDHADRLFDSLAQTWYGVTHSAADVKELIPEFFYQPEIFVNNNNIKFGVRQDGRELDQVELPPWCTDAHDFVRIHREALESEYVSAHLHEWIDLIFGCKQYGPDAVEAANTYHPYSYEQCVSDINFSEEEEHTKQRIISHIDNFGQSPIQLFRKRHPPRSPILHIYQPFKSRPVFMTPQGVVHRVLQGKAIVKLCLASGERLVAIGDNGVVAIHSFRTLGALEGGHHMSAPSQASTPSPATPATLERSSTGPSFRSSPMMAPLSLDPKLLGERVGASIISPSMQTNPGTPSLGRRKPGFERKKLFSFEANSSFQSRAVQAGMKKCPVTEYSYVFTSLPDRELLFSSGLWNNSATISELVAANTNPYVQQSLFGHNDVVTCLAVDSANTLLVTGSKDTTLLLWTIRLRSFPLAVLKATLVGHDDRVLCVAINSDLDVIASGGADGVAVLHDCQGKYERTLRHPRGGSVNLVAITDHGTVIFFSNDDYFLYLFSINGAILACVDATVKLHCLTLTKDSRCLVTGGELRQNSSVFLRSTADLSLIHKFPSASASPVRSIAIHKDEQVMAAGFEDGCIVFYSA